MPAPRHYLLVDGHSVIYAWPELRQLHQTRPAQARLQLVSLLQQLQDSSDWRVTVVFDGRFGTTPVRRQGDLVEAYSTADETADSIIERLTSSSGKAEQILVITADTAERHTVESFGAECASPEWLECELESQSLSLQQSLQQVHRQAKWSQ
ncbi:MAG: hypothetical protein B9S32_01820 [Verrucomicrobia bacterium Tous-C9LFEB]|nr:MAG: hypothetical protein B9S32_01820 [Verrucomicrobia bacterium Tous-C9LFEB]